MPLICSGSERQNAHGVPADEIGSGQSRPRDGQRGRVWTGTRGSLHNDERQGAVEDCGVSCLVRGTKVGYVLVFWSWLVLRLV